MFRKALFYIVLVVSVACLAYFAFLNFATYSEGVRSGELIKISTKGYVFKTWEGEISQGIAGAQIFRFSVLDTEKEVIEKLKTFQGQYVKVTYQERYRTFPFWGDTRYFILDVQKEKSPLNFK